MFMVISLSPAHVHFSNKNIVYAPDCLRLSDTTEQIYPLCLQNEMEWKFEIEK